MAQDPVQVTISNNRPPIFHGKDNENCDVHWLLFEDYYTENNIPAAQRVRKFRITLKDDARDWYQKNEALFPDLDALKTQFTTAFGRHVSRAELLKQFHSLTLNAGETLPSYGKRVKDLARQAQLTDEELIINQFVEGLPASIKGMVRARRDTTLHDALLTAQAVHMEAPSAAGATAFAMQPSAQSIAEALASQMQTLYLANNASARSRSRERGRSQDKNRFYDSYDRKRSTSGNSSRSPSWGRNQYQRKPTPRRHSPNDTRRKVSFGTKSRSQSPVSCYFCKGAHRYADCRELRKALQNGSFQNQNF